MCRGQTWLHTNSKDYPIKRKLIILRLSIVPAAQVKHVTILSVIAVYWGVILSYLHQQMGKQNAVVTDLPVHPV